MIEGLSSFVTAIMLSAPVAGAQAEEADRLFAEEAWEGAARAYEALVVQEPENGRAWLRLGVARTSLAQYREAVAALEEADKLSWIAPLTRFHLARAHALAGDAERALSALEGAIEAGFAAPDQLLSGEAFASLGSDPRFEKLLSRARVNAEPCEHIPEFRQFDFWIGEWEVTSGGQKAGENRIEKLEAGCLLLENWTSASGGTGKSMNFYDGVRKTWNQVWVDGSGTSIVAAGSFRDGAMHFEGEHHYPNGTSELFRMSFTPRGDGSVRQFIEQSRDSGKSWYVWFDGTYEKKK